MIILNHSGTETKIIIAKTIKLQQLFLNESSKLFNK